MNTWVVVRFDGLTPIGARVIGPFVGQGQANAWITQQTDGRAYSVTQAMGPPPGLRTPAMAPVVVRAGDSAVICSILVQPRETIVVAGFENFDIARAWRTAQGSALGIYRVVYVQGLGF